MKYRIVSDSSSNLLKMDRNIDYTTVPLKILIGENSYQDDLNLDVEDLVDKIEKSESSSTSCPNTQEWMDAFEGADAIFAITISSNLSGSYNSAMLAKEEFLQTHPDCKVHVIDSLYTGGDMQLLIEKLADCIEQNMEFEEIVKEIQAYQETTRILFVLESLHNLAKNGRVSHAVANIAGFLGIRFIGKASEQGTIQQAMVAKGPKRTMSALISQILKMGYEGGKMRISHCLNYKMAETLKNELLEKFPIADIIIDTCGGLCSYYAERGGMIIGFEVVSH